MECFVLQIFAGAAGLPGTDIPPALQSPVSDSEVFRKSDASAKRLPGGHVSTDTAGNFLFDQRPLWRQVPVLGGILGAFQGIQKPLERLIQAISINNTFS